MERGIKKYIYSKYRYTKLKNHSQVYSPNKTQFCYIAYLMRAYLMKFLLAFTLIQYSFLLYGSVITRGVICQFRGPYFPVRPVKLLLVSFPPRPIYLRDIRNILLTSFSRSILWLRIPVFFSLIYGLRFSLLGHKLTGKKNLVRNLQ